MSCCTIIIAAQLAVSPPAADPAAAEVQTTAVDQAPVTQAAAPQHSHQDDIKNLGDEEGQEIVVKAKSGTPPGDPAEAVNQASFKAMQSVDKAFVGPIAKGYERGVPKQVRQGVRNALNNLSEPVNFLNFLLQLKPGKAMKALGRFAINSTVGIAGLVDVAKRKPFKLEYRRNGFANTFGYYGIGQGAYLYLPLIGPTTVRDVIGRVLDLSLLPGVVGKPFNDPKFALASSALKSIDERLERDDMLTVIQEDCPDPYAAERTWYLVKRQAVIDGLHNRKVDVMSQLPQCLVDGLKKRAEDRAKLLPAGAAQPDLEADLSPRS